MSFDVKKGQYDNSESAYAGSILLKLARLIPMRALPLRAASTMEFPMNSPSLSQSVHIQTNWQ